MHWDLCVDILSVNLIVLWRFLSVYFSSTLQIFTLKLNTFCPGILIPSVCVEVCWKTWESFTLGSNLPKILWPKFYIYLETMIWINFHSFLKNELFAKYISHYTWNRIIKKHNLIVFWVQTSTLTSYFVQLFCTNSSSIAILFKFISSIVYFTKKVDFCYLPDEIDWLIWIY